jgi:predicted HTH domain antitoxin
MRGTETKAMAITLELPQEIEQQLEEAWNGDLPRKILEAVAVEGYRQGVLSRGQVSELLRLSFHDTETFLKEHEAYSPFSMEEVEKGRVALEGLLKR